MLMLKYKGIRVATWEDLRLSGFPEDDRWLNTPCCMANPLLILNVPFGHILFVGCGGCGDLVGGLAVAREGSLPDAKYLHPIGEMFVVKQPGSTDAPSVRFRDNCIAEVVVGDRVIWQFEIATEAGVAAWKKDLGKGDL